MQIAEDYILNYNFVSFVCPIIRTVSVYTEKSSGLIIINLIFTSKHYRFH